MAQTQINSQSIDNPLITPEQDKLGYAPFAQYLADSICKMNFSGGFAIAVYGGWNSGKSTLLHFVINYLQQKPENEQPIIVRFNPWLFSGNENITRQFFDQLQDVLSKVTSVPKGLKERIADIANVISEIPLPYTKATKAVAKLFDEEEKEASEIKEEVEQTVAQQPRRIVIAIDDIDRLRADDIRTLFRIFKAIPHFTNVVYLLFFNKDVVVKVLAETGESLEKIIQFAFEIPTPDKTSLRRLLFEKLNSIMADTPKELFESNRWGNIYLRGIDHFITNISDIVSFTNALTVTYPVVKGEVNAIDFLAIESLHLFCPIIYEAIYNNFPVFIEEDNYSGEKIKSLVNTWIAQLNERDKQPIQYLLMQLFPKLEDVWGNINRDDRQQQLECCNQRRICCPEIFPIYFRLNLTTGELADNQFQYILALVDDTKAFSNKLIELTHQKRADGITQFRVFLEQLENYTENKIPQDKLSKIIQSLCNVCNEISYFGNESQTMFDLGNKIIITNIVYKVLHRLDENTRSHVSKFLYKKAN
ncbi:KAP family NTPase [Chlorogloeopsis sp. ULAP02]|uniref:KAP family NTPase n=1 Tax=Chlorogloeopsis sp. ULAP02 TaxID=3107926 RepID=UPI0031375CA6